MYIIKSYDHKGQPGRLTIVCKFVSAFKTTHHSLGGLSNSNAFFTGLVAGNPRARLTTGLFSSEISFSLTSPNVITWVCLLASNAWLFRWYIVWSLFSNLKTVKLRGGNVNHREVQHLQGMWMECIPSHLRLAVIVFHRFTSVHCWHQNAVSFPTQVTRSANLPTSAGYPTNQLSSGLAHVQR